ncbi:Glycosyltransferase involved in cell wall bisynthesis [Singulisphaera sp. GP187]|uniref:glycosyltransferase family 2 protein n=1 Tax=Singulisphaera sp. GP187 TaxID=1882752 RepID=UPI000927893F|nr:glycosyltransferase family 2 protein [Singulisphaera sp. GP187]SIO55282.1 Glycosyltransferase involved in cell wall bisynthesis [Singulisphaera sp. GP187]
MSRTPLISVCVPTYNYARFIDDCIRSVMDQTLTDWELVICDDCSTDHTEEVVRRYAAADPRIRYVRNERRLGMNGNVKRAAETGTGRYLKMLCSDDWMAPRCLEVLSGLMEEFPSATIATSAVIQTNEAGVASHVQFLFGSPVSLIRGEQMLDQMARAEGFGGHSSFFIRASSYREVGGYNDTLLYAADYDLAARLCRVGDYLHSDAPLFYGRTQPESSSSVNPLKLWDVQDWFEIPDAIYRPRPPFGREWRRYQGLTARLTARYLANYVLEHLRGHHTYANALGKLLIKHGNFAAGIPFLLVDAPSRLIRKLATTNLPASQPPESWMGPPPAHRGAIAVEDSGTGGAA